MAKKKGSGKKASKNAPPSWMSDAVFALSQDFPRLVEHLNGTAQSPIIDCSMAAMLIWQRVFPSDKKSAELRDEAIKLGVIESVVKILFSESSPSKSFAVGILGSLLETESGRDVFAGLRTQPMIALLECLEKGNPCLAGYTCRAIARLATAPDSKLMVMKAIQNWDWKPLVKIFILQNKTSMLGGDFAASDAATIISSLCCEATLPENAAPNSYKELCSQCSKSLVKAEAVERLTDTCVGRYPNWCKVSITEALQVLMKGSDAVSARRKFIEHGGPEAIVEMLKNPFLNLKSKANIAECLCLSMLSKHHTVSEDSQPSTSLVEDNALGTCLVSFDKLKELGVVPVLLDLCLGPEGPLSENIEQISSDTKSKSGKKKKGKGSKKKKAMKLDPGMPEAQTFASGCLRIMSVDEKIQEELMKQKCILYITPLLTSKVHQARWNAREVLLNLATSPIYIEEMSKYGVPLYITQSNVKRRFFLSNNS